jgi:hypothetical protein
MNWPPWKKPKPKPKPVEWKAITKPLGEAAEQLRRAERAAREQAPSLNDQILQRDLALLAERGQDLLQQVEVFKLRVRTARRTASASSRR